MISSLLVLTLAFAAGDPGKARKAYTDCLGAFVRSSVEKPLTVEEVEAALPGACAVEEAEFRKIAVAYDVQQGIGRRTSEAGVNDEVKDLRSTALERYRFELEMRQPQQ